MRNRLTNILVAVKATLANIALDAAKAFEAEWSSFVERQEIKAEPIAQLDLSRCCAQEPWVCDTNDQRPWEIELPPVYTAWLRFGELDRLERWGFIGNFQLDAERAMRLCRGALLNGVFRFKEEGLEELFRLGRKYGVVFDYAKTKRTTSPSCDKALSARKGEPCCLTGGKAPHGWVKTVELPRVKMRSGSGAEYTWRNERVDQTRSRASKASAKARRASRALKALC